MAIFTSIQCSANTLRGQLKHSWLENQLCNKTAHDVVSFWRQEGWPALEMEFEGRVGDVMRLSDDLEDGFSPAQLVDRLTPFAGLSEELKMEIRKAVHTAYLKSSGICDLKAPLREAATHPQLVPRTPSPMQAIPPWPIEALMAGESALQQDCA